MVAAGSDKPFGREGHRPRASGLNHDTLITTFTPDGVRELQPAGHLYPAGERVDVKPAVAGVRRQAGGLELLEVV